MNESQKKLLNALAKKYEIPSFYDDDPSQFLKRYKTKADIEIAGFIAAMLAFGNRKQFIPKIDYIFKIAEASENGIYSWIKNRCFKKDFAHGEKKFYRFYSFDDMQNLFEEISNIIEKNKTFGEFFKLKYEEANKKSALQKSRNSGSQPSTNLIQLSEIISQAFPNSKIVPKGKNSAKKRIHMYLRWMVRKNSSVDLGLWSWYPQSNLIIPLDVHVMQMAIKLKLIPPDSKPDRKTAEKLTELLKEAFPEDPVRGDFALFGAGVDEKFLEEFF